MNCSYQLSTTYEQPLDTFIKPFENLIKTFPGVEYTVHSFLRRVCFLQTIILNTSQHPVKSYSLETMKYNKSLDVEMPRPIFDHLWRHTSYQVPLLFDRISFPISSRENRKKRERHVHTNYNCYFWFGPGFRFPELWRRL